jgi:hypothetical protein
MWEFRKSYNLCNLKFVLANYVKSVFFKYLLNIYRRSEWVGGPTYVIYPGSISSGSMHVRNFIL